MSDGQYYFAKKDNICFLKLVGDLKYTDSASLDAFLNEIYENTVCSDFKLDLSRAIYLDSTVLGIIANLSAFVISAFSRKLDIFSTNKDIRTLLINTGFLEVSNIHEDSLNMDLDYKKIKSENIEIGQVMIDAHRNLAELDIKNKEKYLKFVEILSNEINEIEN